MKTSKLDVKIQLKIRSVVLKWNLNQFHSIECMNANMRQKNVANVSNKN